jgi:hypothetical protein
MRKRSSDDALDAQATTLRAVRPGQVWAGKGSQPAVPGGD